MLLMCKAKGFALLSNFELNTLFLTSGVLSIWFNQMRAKLLALPASGLKTLRAKLKVLLRLGKSGRFHRATLVGKYEPRF
jgi:hypothetical protein